MNPCLRKQNTEAAQPAECRFRHSCECLPWAHASRPLAPCPHAQGRRGTGGQPAAWLLRPRGADRARAAGRRAGAAGGGGCVPRVVDSGAPVLLLLLLPRVPPPCCICKAHKAHMTWADTLCGRFPLLWRALACISKAHQSSTNAAAALQIRTRTHAGTPARSWACERCSKPTGTGGGRYRWYAVSAVPLHWQERTQVWLSLASGKLSRLGGQVTPRQSAHPHQPLPPPT